MWRVRFALRASAGEPAENTEAAVRRRGAAANSGCRPDSAVAKRRTLVASPASKIGCLHKILGIGVTWLEDTVHRFAVLTGTLDSAATRPTRRPHEAGLGESHEVPRIHDAYR